MRRRRNALELGRTLAVVLAVLSIPAVAARLSSEGTGDGDAISPGPTERSAERPPPLPGQEDWLPRIQRGLSEREYWASPNGGGLQAPNRAQNLRTYFDATGIRVVDRSAAGSPDLLGLRLVGWGRGASIASVAPGEVSNQRARIEIARPGLVEWYLNSASGLEQGFTLEDRPEGEGPLLLTLAVSGGHASLHGEAVTFQSATGRRLQYGHLVATDATGREWPARLEVPAPDTVRIQVDEAGAVYPLTIDPLLTATADTQLESNQISAGLGDSVAGAGDVNGDGYADVIVGAFRYDAGQIDEGAAFVFLGSPSGIASGNPATAAAQLESNWAGAQLGRSVAGAGDVNGDGYDDVIVGAWHYSAGQSEEGAAFIFHGSASGIANGNPATAAAQLESDQSDADLGLSVAGAGDVNGDGYADVIVGAPAFDAPQASEGAAFVFLGSAGGIVGTNPATAAAQLESNDFAASLGSSVAGAGDVNGDGYADVIVGAPTYTAGQFEEGAAFVFLGSASGIASGNPATADAQLESNQASSSMGRSVAGAGDVNGDGYADVIVGAPFYDAGGGHVSAAFVFHGSITGIGDANPSTADAQFESDQGGGWLGHSVAGAGDVNGDGYADVIVGAPLYNDGTAFVFLGGAGGTPSGGPAAAAAQLESGQADAWLGISVAGAGDVNGDGYADVIVGASVYDAGEDGEGAAFVYHGGAQGIVSGNPSTAATQVESDQANAILGFSVAPAGDVNGDGYADVIIGAIGFDAGELGEGAVFVFHGGAGGIASGGLGVADAQIEGNQAGVQLGRSMAGAGDVNGDGYADIIVGASSYDAGEIAEGAAFVFLGSGSGIASGGPAAADAQLESNQAVAGMGYSVDGAGDVNGDGYADVIVGASNYNAGQNNEGAAFVFHGSASGIADGNPATAASRFETDQVDGGRALQVAGVGDVNGDGFADVIVGAGFYEAGAGDADGAAFVLQGSVNGIASGGPGTADAQLESGQAVAQMGITVAGAGDVNGDGYADVIVAATGYDAGESNEGAAFVFNGSASGVASGNPATADAQLEANQGTASFGTSLDGAGDVNGDGFADVIVGARNYDAGELGEGAAFVFLGSAGGIASGGPATAAAQLESDQPNARMGSGVSGAGDVNGDGFADVIVGAPNYDAGENDEGVFFVFYGGGGVTGRSVLPQQLRGGGDSTPVQSWGTAEDPDDFKVSLIATHPEGRGRVKAEVEACPNGEGFGSLACLVVVSSTWTDVTASPAGVTLSGSVSGLVVSTLYRWRARVLYAPFAVTQPGITPPPSPAHGPWRRFQGQAFEADLRIGLAGDTDADGLSNDDEINVHGTDPSNPDHDGDGLSDGAEVALGTSPLNEDSDGDDVCDGGIQTGTCTAPGPDNCPFIVNGGQNNSDALPAGDACQCGDVNTDFVVDASDVQIVRENLMEVTPLSGPFNAARCNVIGLSDGGATDCDVSDIFVLQRFVGGQSVTVEDACAAYLGP